MNDTVIISNRPKLREFPSYPATSSIAALAAGISIARWADPQPFQSLFDPQHFNPLMLLMGVFIHASVEHLVFNLYWLWIFGTAIERIFGKSKTIGLFLFLAVGANLVQYALSMPGIGLSGVGYGLFGLLWIASPRDERFRSILDKNTAFIFILCLGVCYWLTKINAYNVGNVAHITGLLLGCSVGFIIVRPSLRLFAYGMILLILLFGLWGSSLGRPLINGFEQAHYGVEELSYGNNKGAAEWLSKAVTLEPDLAWAWFDLGLAYGRMGDKDNAHKAFLKAYGIEPTNPKYTKMANKP